MKNLILILLLFTGIFTSSAQEVYSSSGKTGYYKKMKKQKGYDPSKLVIGGGLNAGFSSGEVSVGISPFIGYRFADNFLAGVGLGYQYYKYLFFSDQNYNNYYATENIVYPSVWARYFVWKNIFADATLEYDFISQVVPIDDNPGSANYGILMPTKSTFAVPCLLMGVGYKWSLGGRVSFFLEGMYDVLQQPNSPYVGQFIPRAGVSAGF